MAQNHPSIGDHVSFRFHRTDGFPKTNFGQVKGTVHGPTGLEYKITLPSGHMITAHISRVSLTPELPEYTIGDQVTVASFVDDAPPHLRLPRSFWASINPVRIMMIRWTAAQGYTYLFEDIPVEYTRWVPEKYLVPGDFGTSADILGVLRDEMDPALYQQLLVKLAARSAGKTLQDA